MSDIEALQLQLRLKEMEITALAARVDEHARILGFLEGVVGERDAALRVARRLADNGCGPGCDGCQMSHGIDVYCDQSLWPSLDLCTTAILCYVGQVLAEENGQ